MAINNNNISRSEKALWVFSSLACAGLVATGVAAYFASRGGLPSTLHLLQPLAHLHSWGSITLMACGSVLATAPLGRMIQLTASREKNETVSPWLNEVVQRKKDPSWAKGDDFGTWCQEVMKTINSRKEDEFKKLLETGKNCDYLERVISESTGATLFIHLGKRDDYKPLMEILLAYRIDYGAVDTLYGNTALHWALANASNEMADFILEKCGKGAHLDIQSTLHGNSPLHLAVGKGYRDKSSDNELLTISNLKLTKKLIAQGANLNLGNSEGNTPLHLAYLRRDDEMVKMLLEAGADPFRENNDGNKPCQMRDLSDQQRFDLLKSTVFRFDMSSFPPEFG